MWSCRWLRLYCPADPGPVCGDPALVDRTVFSGWLPGTCSDRVFHQVLEHGEVGVPAIQDRRHLAEPHRFGRGMTSELVADSTAGDDDAGLTVSAQKYA